MTTTSPQLVGLSGYARAGKDTVAKILVDRHGFTAIAYADLLRSCVEALDPLVGSESRGWEPGDNYQLPVRYNDLLERYGYEGAKKSVHGDEMRGLLQRMGTEVGRKLLGDNIWVEATMNSLKPGVSYVFTDCRFPNEAKAVRDDGGWVIRVERPGYGPANDHPSETSLDKYPFDAIITNDGTLDELAVRVAGNLRYLELGRRRAS